MNVLGNAPVSVWWPETMQSMFDGMWVPLLRMWNVFVLLCIRLTLDMRICILPSGCRFVIVWRQRPEAVTIR